MVATTIWLTASGWSTAHEYAQAYSGDRASFCGRSRRVPLVSAPPDMPRCRRCLATDSHRMHAPRIVTVHLPEGDA